MFDPISQGLSAVSARSAYAPVLVFAAGAVTSLGPCVAPRFIAVAGLTAHATRRKTLLLTGAFVFGLTVTYAAFGAITPLLPRAVTFSAYTYGALALFLAVGGVITLWRERCASHPAQPERGRESGGAALLLGASFALVVSPCCAPVVLGILAYTSAAGNAAYGSALLACFALGHAVSLLAVAIGTNGVMRTLQRYAVREAAAVVSGALMLALACYYAVLA